MEKEQYLVSICIPTYNRAPYLKKCLDSLVCQPEFLDGKVEIVVSDNASTDDTFDVMREYTKKYGNIVYNRNSQNLGQINGDYNFAIVLSLGHGVLRKVGGDTRVYLNGSLKYFCDAAVKYSRTKPVMYFCNGNNLHGIKEEAKITDLGQFLVATSVYSTWLDTFFLWDEDCEDLIPFAKRSQSGFWFIEKNVELFRKKAQAIFFTEIVIEGMNFAKGDKKDISYGIFKVFYVNYLGIFAPLVETGEISKIVFDVLEKDLFFYFFTYSVVQWEINKKRYVYSDTENLKRLVFQQCQDKPYFQEFVGRYNVEKLKIRIRNVPVIGVPLVRALAGVKHMLQRK